MCMPRPYSKTTHHQDGFTLIELLITIVIIGVLSVIGINSFISSQLKSRDAQRKSDLANISRAVEMYYNDKGEYPEASGGLILGIPWGSNDGLTDVDGGGAIYMSKLPADPGEFQYYYVSGINGVDYQLYARLENDKDKLVVKDGDGEPTTYSGTDCSGEECNFAVTSPNTQL
jgi:general secretion pathway protein G